MDTPKTVTRSAFHFLSGTLLSRLTGLGRDMSMAFCFGSDPGVAAFMVAFRFANLLRRLVGEGPLASGFIPYFERMKGESTRQGALFFRDFLFSLSFVVIALILAVEMVLYCLWKFGDFFPGTLEIVYLTLLMFPGLLFLSLFGIGAGFMQSQKKFFLSGFAPTFFNLVWMGSVFLFHGKGAGAAMMDLSLAVVLGFFLQWAMLVPEMVRFFKSALFSLKDFFNFRLFSQDVRALFKPLLLSMVGVGAMQINAALDALFARYASLEGPAFLWYAIRIEQLPLALFGIAFSSALLPSLSRLIKAGAYEEHQQMVAFSLKKAFTLMFPCTLGMFVLGVLGINLLYGRGDFSQDATFQTYLCLCGYAVGLVPSVFVLLLAPSFYAAGDFKTPTKASLYSVGLNAVLTLIFVVFLGWGAASIAIATSIASFVNYRMLEKKLGSVWSGSLRMECVRGGLSTVCAALSTLVLGALLNINPTLFLWLGWQAETLPRDFFSQVVSCLGSSCLFVGGWILFGKVFKAESLFERSSS